MKIDLEWSDVPRGSANSSGRLVLQLEPDRFGMARLRLLSQTGGFGGSLWTPCSPRVRRAIGSPASLPPDGTYRATVTPEELQAAGASADGADGNAGTIDITFSGDQLRMHWSGTHEPYDCTATQVIDGDQVRVEWTSGCGGEWAYQWTQVADGLQLAAPDYPGIFDALIYRTWTKVDTTASTSGAPSTQPSTPIGSEGPVASPALGSVWSATGPSDGFRAPGAVALDPQGQLWVADTGHDRFVILAADGSVVDTWGSGGTGDGQFSLQRDNGDPYGGIAFAPDGSFYVLDVGNLRVQRFDKDRNYLGSWGTFGTDAGQYADPIGITVDDKGQVYVLDDVRDVVEMYDPVGTVLGSFDAHPASALGQNSANGLAVDADGNVYVSACCNAGNFIEKFDPEGDLLSTIGGPGSGDGQFTDQPWFMVFDAQGRLFVSEGGPVSHLKVFGPDGGFLSTLDTSTPDDSSQHWTTGGLALDGTGNLYVADLTDGAVDRVKKFQVMAPLAP